MQGAAEKNAPVAKHCVGIPEEARESMMLLMRAGRTSARVLGVLETIDFHTCSAAERTVYATSLRAMYRLATTCRKAIAVTGLVHKLLTMEQDSLSLGCDVTTKSQCAASRTGHFMRIA